MFLRALGHLDESKEKNDWIFSCAETGSMVENTFGAPAFWLLPVLWAQAWDFPLMGSCQLVFEKFWILALCWLTVSSAWQDNGMSRDWENLLQGCLWGCFQIRSACKSECMHQVGRPSLDACGHHELSGCPEMLNTQGELAFPSEHLDLLHSCLVTVAGLRTPGLIAVSPLLALMFSALSWEWPPQMWAEACS